MKGQLTLFLDQYGNRFYSRTLRELREQVPGRVSKMYHDTERGTVQVGYVIGQHWLTAFQPVELPA
ncbi:hypothetical protein [Haloferula sargassicola]|uniref:Uncharacterized protein n=1 Tax=Haloferula sargassicola TaxID=490096 RepID=A0ABP9UVP8_9BACT